MTQKTTTLRADHVGSFLRPPEVLEARRKFDAGEISESQLHKAEDEAVLKILQVQKDAGLEIFSDGEYRRTIYSGALNESLEGLVPGDEEMASMPSVGMEPTRDWRLMRLKRSDR
jgi:5-methyltetrahydropteroyltriglutamate--homocysteine methyltransferase